MSTRSISVPVPTYSRHGNICVMQLLDKSDSAPDSCSWPAFFFLLQIHPEKVSVSLHQDKQRVVILWHFTALHQPLSTALCSFSSPLLLRRSQSFTPSSLMVLLKYSLRTQPPSHVSFPSEKQ